MRRDKLTIGNAGKRFPINPYRDERLRCNQYEGNTNQCLKAQLPPAKTSPPIPTKRQSKKLNRPKHCGRYIRNAPLLLLNGTDNLFGKALVKLAMDEFRISKRYPNRDRKKTRQQHELPSYRLTGSNSQGNNQPCPLQP